MNMFSYTPVDHDRHEIRLLTFNFVNPPLSHENLGDSPSINLSLSHAFLDAEPAPVYNALSYVWGDANDTRPIILDGHVFQVTKNLFTALTQLHASQVRARIWIDAICINQSDNDEKAVQVRLMSSVYSLAKNVLIWLGPEPDGGAFQTIRTLAAMYRDSTDEGYISIETITDREDLQFEERMARLGEEVVELADSGGDEDGRLDFEALWKLFFDRPWWHRVWVVQEVVLAKAAMVLCGNEFVLWEDVKDIWFVLLAVSHRVLRIGNDKYSNLANAVNIIIGIFGHLEAASTNYEASLINAQERGVGEAGLSLFEALEVTFQSNTVAATDERDMIYGILGMVQPEDRCKIPVDYSSTNTMERVSFDVSKVLLMKYGPNILSSYQRLFSVKHHPAAIPSWVIDRTSEFRTVLAVKVEDRHPINNLYHAAKGTSWEEWSARSEIGQASYGEPRISLPGRIVGRVANVGKTLVDMTVQKYSAEWYAVVTKWLFELIDMLETYRASLAGNSEFLTSTLENVWRVPVLDSDVDGTARADDGLWGEVFLAGFETLTLTGKKQSWFDVDDEEQTELPNDLFMYLGACKVQRQRSFVDSTGRPGTTLQDVQVGDQVVIFPGAHVPFVIRPVTQKGGDVVHHMVGAAYVYSIMDGEAMEDDSEFQDIWLA